MKVEVECAACVLHRGYMEIVEATSDYSLQFQAMSALTRLLAKEFKHTTVPARLGTKRDRLIKRITRNQDPYKEKKRLSNQKALKILPLANKLVTSESSLEARFRKACLCSIVGNVIEFDIPDHTFNFNNIGKLIESAEKDLVVDQIITIFNLAKDAKEILYLADNAGEIAFDTLLVRELKKLSAHVEVAVKGKPIVNDATMQDAKIVGMHEVADDIVTTGTDTVGLVLEECSKQFLTLYKSADLVIAKGMGYAETLTELNPKTPHALLLRTKCDPIANFFGVARGKNVAKVLP